MTSSVDDLSSAALERAPPIDDRSPAASDDASSDDRRFGGVARLYGATGLERLRSAHIAVIGLGGVGSWVVEACARSGIGRLTLIDLDHVSESNVNRQSHALESTLGAAKADVMACRVADINPLCRVEPIEEFVEAGNLDLLVPGGRFDFVVDAIDHVRAKTALIAHCHAAGTPLITVGGAGGRTDAARVRVADLAHTLQEPMLAKVRKNLRTRHGFPRNVKQPFGIPAVFSDQPLRGNEARIAVDREGMTGLNCAGFGSLVSVTAVFGFVAAGLLVDRLARGE